MAVGGLLASTFHLGHPERAIKALSQWRTSWLSREGIAAVVTLVIMGLGLIGGSLARALRAQGFCEQIIGYGYRTPSLERGVELGVIDDFTLDLQEAVERADILVLAAPTLVTAEILSQVIPMLKGDDSDPVRQG